MGKPDSWLLSGRGEDKDRIESLDEKRSCNDSLSVLQEPVTPDKIRKEENVVQLEITGMSRDESRPKGRRQTSDTHQSTITVPKNN
jgi:hypothetical protein